LSEDSSFDDLCAAARGHLVRCPGHNITIADPSDNYETETACDDLDRRTTQRIAHLGHVAHFACR
jgi:hypothetical protein